MTCPWNVFPHSSTCACILAEGFPKKSDCPLTVAEFAPWRSCADEIARIYAHQQEPVDSRSFDVAYGEWETMNRLVFKVLPVVGV